jgi:transcriptional regulator with XRE-family HTH domain
LSGSLSPEMAARPKSAAKQPDLPIPAPDGVSQELELSQRIRSLREEKGMSLRAMSRAAGVSVSFLSQVERGTAAPSIASLIRMARALDETVASLFEPRVVGRLIRAGERPALVHPNRQWSEELLSPRDFARLQLIRSTLAPGGSTGDEALSYDVAETCVLVESGRLDFWLDGEWMQLEPGDCLAYDPHQPHRLANPGTKPTVLLFASSPPSY